MERRWSPRTPIFAPVEIRSDSQVIAGHAQDIGMEGMYVETGKRLPENAPIRADFTLDIGGKQQTYSLGGAVVHAKDGGLGIRFDDPDIVLCRHLNNVLYGEMGEREMASRS